MSDPVRNSKSPHPGSGPVIAPNELISGEGLHVLLNPDMPNWIGIDDAGLAILDSFDGSRSIQDTAFEHADRHGLELTRAMQDVATITGDAVRYKFLGVESAQGPAYTGRQSALSQEPLRDFWIHTNNSCNLACTHCLVSSGPDGDRGLSAARIISAIRDARALGATRFFFTGGEPLIRKDILDLVDAVLVDQDAELAILTNGLQFKGELLGEMRSRSAVDAGIPRLRFQVSLDGARPETNDPIRGEGSFARIVEGIRAAVTAGLDITVSTVVTKSNVEELSDITRLVGECGGRSHHLLWMHRKGRASLNGHQPVDATPDNDALIAAVRRARQAGAAHGVIVDNHEAMKARMRGWPGTKTDLSGAGVNTLCLYSDGRIYPSAAMVQIPELCCGSILEQSLETIWRESEVTRAFRGMTLAKKPHCPDCSIRFLCGGGDIEHAYFYASSRSLHSLADHDPYCELHKAMIRDALLDLTSSRAALLRRDTGFGSPVVLTGMGEGAVHCASESVAAGEDSERVRTTRSECVLSFDLDAPRKLVREFYGDAAEKPKEDLCCPVRPDPADLAHIPKDVVDRFYGCGSPVGDARIKPGEVTLDLGSGAGIDVFIAAKKTGPTGRAIGVDMTDRMLAVAHEQKKVVSANLGYDIVEFHKGFLEKVPLDDRSVDVVTSNCVINLSPDKPKVFSEIWRVLRNHGRMVISDIVSDAEVPPWQRRDPRLWGECISGALTEDELLALTERTGFYGVQILKRSFWKDVEGYRFFSVTLRGYKYAKSAGCVFQGQKAVYLGPFKGISDEEGHWFPRGVPVEVCTDTAAKLAVAPYKGMFRIIAPGANDETFECCSPTAAGSSSCC